MSSRVAGSDFLSGLNDENSNKGDSFTLPRPEEGREGSTNFGEATQTVGLVSKEWNITSHVIGMRVTGSRNL